MCRENGRIRFEAGLEDRICLMVFPGGCGSQFKLAGIKVGDVVPVRPPHLNAKGEKTFDIPGHGWETRKETLLRQMAPMTEAELIAKGFIK